MLIEIKEKFNEYFYTDRKKILKAGEFEIAMKLHREVSKIKSLFAVSDLILYKAGDLVRFPLDIVSRVANKFKDYLREDFVGLFFCAGRRALFASRKTEIDLLEFIYEETLRGKLMLGNVWYFRGAVIKSPIFYVGYNVKRYNNLLDYTRRFMVSVNAGSILSSVPNLV